MNLDQIIESLGLDKLGSSQSRRGSSQADGPRPEGEQQLDPAEDSMAEESEDSDEWDEPDPDEPAGDVAEEVAAPAVEEIRHEIDQLSAEVDSNESAIRGMESQQEDVLERLETVEEHNARLLGIYDRLTAGINPFDEDWDVKYDQARGDEAEDDEHRYGVIDPPENVEMDNTDDTDDRDTVSFEDLKRQRDEQEPESSTPTPDPEPKPAGGGSSPPEPMAAGDAYLDALSPTYATDVLLMEWLTMLIRMAGAPGALKALEYYESIDWINEPVKRQVEDVLSGVEAPGDAEPRPPGDLTTEEHNRSFAFIMKLAQQRQPVPTRAD